jgi:hypothetical protein
LAPDLVEIQQKHGPDVVWVGLTADSEREATTFVRDTNISWPNGYGASKTWAALGVCGPTLFVIDATGRVAWTDVGDRWYHRTDGLRERLDRAIADCLNPPAATR